MPKIVTKLKKVTKQKKVNKPTIVNEKKHDFYKKRVIRQLTHLFESKKRIT